MSIIESEECEYLAVKVVGVGGAGGVAMESMIKAQICGVDFIVADTDAPALESSSAPTKIHLGSNATKGLGAGSNPEMDRVAALDSLQAIENALNGADVVLVVAGMGGGTGTGAVKVIADASKNCGAMMTIGIVTLPFHQEGKMCTEMIEEGVRALSKSVATLIIIPNDSLAAISSPVRDHLGVFKAADAILTEAVRGITDILPTRAFIPVDFADIKRVLPSEHPVTFGVGAATGSDRALKAAQKAMHPLSRGGVDIANASGVLVNISGSRDLTMDDYNDVSKFILSKTREDADIKVCVTHDDQLEDEVKVAVYFSKSESTETIVALMPNQRG